MIRNWLESKSHRERQDLSDSLALIAACIVIAVLCWLDSAGVLR